MKLVVGLGNPGKAYDGTRHNIGFRIIDTFAGEQSLSFRNAKAAYEFAKGMVGNEEVLVIKPQTYMNLSGEAVRHAMAFYKISILDVLIVCDDLAIPLGAIRLRAEGSDGGQNGLKHIIQLLGNQRVARLRFGIGQPPKLMSASSYVLARFSPEDEPVIAESVAHAVKAIHSFLTHGINMTIAKFNRKGSPLLPPKAPPTESLSLLNGDKPSQPPLP